MRRTGQPGKKLGENLMIRKKENLMRRMIRKEREPDGRMIRKKENLTGTTWSWWTIVVTIGARPPILLVNIVMIIKICFADMLKG